MFYLGIPIDIYFEISDVFINMFLTDMEGSPM